MVGSIPPSGDLFYVKLFKLVHADATVLIGIALGKVLKSFLIGDETADETSDNVDKLLNI